MDHTLHAATVRRRTTTRLGIIGTTQLNDLAILVLNNLLAADQVRIAQTHLLTRRQTIVLLGRLLHKVVAVDIDLTREGHLACTCSLVLGVVDAGEVLGLILGIVGNRNLQRLQNSHTTLSSLIQILAHAELHQAQVDHVIALSNTNLLGKCTHRCRGVTLTTQSADCRHTGIVPTHYDTALNEFQQLTLTHHRVGQVQTSKLILVAGENLQLFDKPIVQRAVNVELQSTDRVSDLLDRVALTVCIVIHRVDAPLVTRTVVISVNNTIHNRVTEQHIGVSHIDLSTQHAATVLELACTHTLEQIQVLLDRTIAPGRRSTRNGYRTAVLANLLLSLVVDVCQTLFDEHLCPLVQLLEIVRCIVLASPIETEPLDILFDRIYILGILLYGVGIVETQVTLTAILLSQTEVQADTLGVSNMQITVRLGRETSLNSCITLGDGTGYDLFEKIERLLSAVLFVNVFNCHNLKIFGVKFINFFVIFCSIRALIRSQTRFLCYLAISRTLRLSVITPSCSSTTPTCARNIVISVVASIL